MVSVNGMYTEGEEMKFAYREVTTTTTATANDRVIGVDTSSNAVTVTLPSAASVRTGFLLTIKDIGGNAETTGRNITVSRGNGDTIDSFANVTLNAEYGAISVVSNGAHKWHVH